MKVSSSAFYAWQKCPVSNKTIADAELTNRIFDINRMARRAYWYNPVRRHTTFGTDGSISPIENENLHFAEQAHKAA